MTRGKAIIFSAPSGAGKTTIVHHLLNEELGLKFSISATTRAKRKVERAGKDYYYMSVEEFKEKIAKEDFVEWEEVYTNNFYGTLKSEINRIWATGNHVIFDVDVKGGISLKKYFGDQAKSIFVMPPSIDALRERLEGRETETPESIARRIGKAEFELGQADQFDEILINDQLEVACINAKNLVLEFLNEGE